jgi:site-specific DNA recombinase
MGKGEKGAAMKKRKGSMSSVTETPCMGGVIYLRVSYDDQVDAVNLGNQEQKCRCYCDGKGINVLQVFIDPGESARTADRPEFQRMLAFCKAHRREIGYVVVQDLSRFARNNRDQAQFISELTTNGVKLCSVYEPNVDDTAAGKLAANIHGTFNQYFSDALSEKMKDRMRAAVLAGRFPWPAPIGYLNDSRSRTGSNLIPDPERAPYIRKVFELMATGDYKKIAVLKIVTEDGLRTRKGKKLSAQTFEETLKKPVYCG